MASVFSRRFLASLITEFLGLFFLLFIVGGSVICSQNDLGHAYLSIMLTVGFTAAPLSKAFGPVSFQANPAMTIVLYWREKVSFFEGLFTIAAQCSGSASGIYLIKQILLPHLVKKPFTPSIQAGLSVPQGFGIELILSFFLILIILFVTERERGQSDSALTSLYVAMATMACKFFASPLTGGCFNPAVAFGPSYAFDLWTNHWVYWVAPIGGGLLASTLYDILKALVSTPHIKPIKDESSDKLNKEKEKKKTK